MLLHSQCYYKDKRFYTYVSLLSFKWKVLPLILIIDQHFFDFQSVQLTIFFILTLYLLYFAPIIPLQFLCDISGIFLY